MCNGVHAHLSAGPANKQTGLGRRNYTNSEDCTCVDPFQYTCFAVVRSCWGQTHVVMHMSGTSSCIFPWAEKDRRAMLSQFEIAKTDGNRNQHRNQHTIENTYETIVQILQLFLVSTKSSWAAFPDPPGLPQVLLGSPRSSPGLPQGLLGPPLVPHIPLGCPLPNTPGLSMASPNLLDLPQILLGSLKSSWLLLAPTTGFEVHMSISKSFSWFLLHLDGARKMGSPLALLIFLGPLAYE